MLLILTSAPVVRSTSKADNRENNTLIVCLLCHIKFTSHK